MSHHWGVGPHSIVGPLSREYGIYILYVRVPYVRTYAYIIINVHARNGNTHENKTRSDRPAHAGETARHENFNFLLMGTVYNNIVVI